MSWVAGLDRAAVRSMLRRVGDPPLELVLWNGERVRGEGSAAAPLGRVHFTDRAALWSFVARGESALADAYCQGRIHVEGDLPALLTALFRAWSPAGSGSRGRWLRRLPGSRAGRADSRRNARRHAWHHYDLGNDFYALWLDGTMSYTCAYYASSSAPLEQAQRAKLDHVARKLHLSPGERVVEAGGGWGALALHLARHYGVTVRSYNVSREQVAWARERARRSGLQGRVEFVEDDYRSITGRYDAFVSVGMLEHVGRPRYPELGRVIDRCLSPQGRGLVHSIGRSRPAPMDPWLGERIFPGAYIPALTEMLELLGPTDLAVLDIENLRPHYARTLEAWLGRFEKHACEIEARFGAEFVRAWRLYLAGSIASFRSGSCQLFQMVFARPECSAIPWTRAHLYARRSAARAPLAQPGAR